MATNSTSTPERLIYADEGFVAGEVGNIAVTIWREAVTRPRFKHQASTLAKVVSQSPGACGFICVVEAACRPPEDDMRRATVEMLNDQGTRLPMLAAVIEGDGFRAAVTRSVLSGMAMIAGSRHVKINFYTSVPLATAWFANSGKFGPLTGLTASIERLRAQMPAANLRRAVRS